MKFARRPLVALLLAFGSASAFALSPPGVAYTSSGGMAFPAGLNGTAGFRAISSVQAGVAQVTDKLDAIVGGRSVAMQMRTAIPWAGMLRGAARFAAGGVPLAAGSVAYELFKAHRCASDGSQWYCDPGKPQEEITELCAWSPTAGTSVCGESLGQVASRVLDAAKAKYKGQTSQCTVGGPRVPDEGFYIETGDGTFTLLRSNPCGGPDAVLEGPTRPNQMSPRLGCKTNALTGEGGDYGPDGKCSTVRLGSTGKPEHATTPEAAAEEVGRYADPSPAPELADDLLRRGVDLAPYADPWTLTGPETVVGTGTGTTTTYTPPGATEPVTVTTPPPSYAIRYENNTYITTVTTTTINTSSPNPAPVTRTEEPQEVEVCGLPGKPACKIDETGTPTEWDSPAAKKDIDDAMKDPRAISADPTEFFPKLPDLQWSFQLPSGCAAIPVTGFGEYLTEIDICAHQDLFHSIMSFVWVVGSAIAAMQIFMRDALATN